MALTIICSDFIFLFSFIYLFIYLGMSKTEYVEISFY